MPYLIAFFGASIGAFTDARKYRVYNALTFPLLLLGLSYHAVTGGWDGLGASLAGASFGFCVLLIPWLSGLMGAGDVKLMAAVGGWLGFGGCVMAFAVASLAAGVYAIVQIIRRGKLAESLVSFQLVFYRVVAVGRFLGKEDLVEACSRKQDSRYRLLPFGVMVPLGVLGAWLWIAWMGGGRGSLIP